MTSWLPWMMTVGWMTEQEVISYKLELARAWLEHGHEDMARDLVKSIIDRGQKAPLRQLFTNS